MSDTIHVPGLETIERLAERDLDRRRFLKRAGVGAGALLAASAVKWSFDQRAYAFDRIAGQAGGDVAIFNSAIELEHQAIFTYTAAAGLDVLTGAALEIATGNLNDHKEHLSVLSDAVKTLGGTPAVAKSTYDLPPGLTTTEAIVAAAFGLEEVAVQAYFAAIPKLSKPELRSAAASIMGVEAQHVAILRDALKLDPVPNAFIDKGLD